MADDNRGSDPNSERRAGERHLACFPAYLEPESREPRLALIRDISTTGALLLTQTAHQPDEKLALKLYVDGDPNKPRVVRAKVIRFSRCSFDRADVWPYNIAVQFEESLGDLQQQVEALAAKQRELGLSGAPRSRP